MPGWKYVYHKADGTIGRTTLRQRAEVDPMRLYVAPSMWRRSDDAVRRFLERVRQSNRTAEAITH